VALALNVLKKRDSRGLSEEVLVKRGWAVRLADGDRCIGMNYADILERAHEVRRWGGEGGVKRDDWNKVVGELMQKKGLTKEAAEAELEAVHGPNRHPFLALRAQKEWAGEGGVKRDDWNKVVGELMQKKGLTKEATEAELRAVQGPNRHPFLISSANKSNSVVANAEKTARSDELNELLADSLKSSDPTWILQVWYDEVQASTGALNRSQKELAKYRAKEFKVGSQDDFRALNEGISGVTLPVKPPPKATVQAKDNWRLECAQLKFTYIQKQEMIHTFVYYQYQKKKGRCPQP
jgi:hypothetical protein